VRPSTIANDPVLLLLPLDPKHIHILKQQSRVNIQRLTGEPEARSLQSTQSLSWCNVTAAVAGCKVLQDGPNHPDIASLYALSDVVEEALTLLWGNATLWQHIDSIGYPLSDLLRHKLEEVKQYTRGIGKSAFWEAVHHACHNALNKLDTSANYELLDTIS
jgi:hypothetical protein